MLRKCLVVVVAALLGPALSDDDSERLAEYGAVEPPAAQVQPPQVTINPYLVEESPYKDTNGDGKLTTEEVRQQWQAFMDGVMTAAGEEDWATVIDLSYKLLHDPGPTEAQIRYNLAFALNAMDEFAKAKGELKASVKVARKAGDEKNAERSELFLKSINTLKPYIEADYAFESPRIFSEREAAARMLAKHGIELPEDPTVLDEVVAELKGVATKLAEVGNSALELVGGPVALAGFGGVGMCSLVWLTRSSEDSAADGKSLNRSRTGSRSKGKKAKVKRF